METRERDAFSNEEYAYIIYFYGFARKNSAVAQSEYVARFPERRIPNVRVFNKVYRRLQETGSVSTPQGAIGTTGVCDENVEDPATSPRLKLVACIHGRSEWKVWCTSAFHPYYYTLVQTIEEGGPLGRMQFCRFMFDADIENAMFLRKILWNNVSKFDKDGTEHAGEVEEAGNLPLTSPKASRKGLPLNVWMGVVDNYLIGPHFLPENLNGEIYEQFLRENLFDLLEDVPLAVRQNMTFQHEGCSRHSVRDWLNHRFPDRWIGKGGPIPWPAGSTDLTPMYSIWGYMKTLVYNDMTPVLNAEELRLRIIDAAQQIQTTLTSSVVKSKMRRRLRTCIRKQGGHVENVL